jgi:hypothetical protein
VRKKAVRKSWGSAFYILYTEDKPQYRKAAIRALKRQGFLHFTVLAGVGYGPGQEGMEESSVKFEVVTAYSPAKDRKIQAVARDICRDNDQQAVFVVRLPAFPKFVVAPQSGETVARDISHMLASHEEVDYVGADLQPRPSRKRAAYRGRVLASFGEWKKLLGEGKIVEGRIVRFFSD